VVDPREQFSLQGPAVLDRLGEIQAFVLDRARAHGLPEKKCFAMAVVVEELVVNIMNYAYPEGEGELEISCHGKSCDGRDCFCIQLHDQGMAFDPLGEPEPDVRAPAEERPVGGLGIHLVRELADRLNYQRRNGVNIVGVCFNLPAGE
jgi:anti-sigma regulatory factor (Ser/Thr protein kinase)